MNTETKTDTRQSGPTAREMHQRPVRTIREANESFRSRDVSDPYCRDAFGRTMGKLIQMEREKKFNGKVVKELSAFIAGL